ncbi:exopolysaccharide biosynthesis protein [Pseudonocardia yuanmonensis]|uniref:Exopolysaccharide biosynthesis protein n=1 Tax=Pseudonocardia yuanmonensis TaxID=1095914 RepID=A0ABP8VVU8_9PSEU
MGEGGLPLRQLWALLARHRRLLVVLGLLGAMLGGAAFFVLSPGYTSRTRVVLSGVRDSSQMLSETQIAMSAVVLERAARRVGTEPGAPAPRGSILATADGNVVELATTSDTPEGARRLADLVTEEYIGFSTQLQADAATLSTQGLRDRQAVLQQRLDTANQRIREVLGSSVLDAPTVAGAQARAELNRLRAEAGDAVEELNQLYGRMQDAEAEASIAQAGTRIIEPATEPVTAPPTLVQLVVGGAIAAPLLGIGALLIAHRSSRRLQSRTEIAAALGAPVLGRLTAPPEPVPSSGSSGTVLSRTLGRVRAPRTGPSQHLIPGQELHYRQVLERVWSDSGGVVRWVAIVAEDDPDAERAAALLVRTSRQLRDGGSGVGPGASGGGAVGAATVSARHPILTEVWEASEAIVLLTPGTRSGEELLAVAEACGDARCSLRGALLVEPGVRRDRTSAPRTGAEDDDDRAEPAHPDPVMVQRNGQHAGGLS